MDLEAQYSIATILFIYHGKNGFSVIKEGQRLNEEITAEEIHVILKKFFGNIYLFFLVMFYLALTKDHNIIQEAKKLSSHDISHNFDLLKPPSLQRRISEMKRLDFYHKLKSIINDIVEVEGKYLISVAPQIENRITILQEETK